LGVGFSVNSHIQNFKDLEEKPRNIFDWNVVHGMVSGTVYDCTAFLRFTTPNADPGTCSLVVINGLPPKPHGAGFSPTTSVDTLLSERFPNAILKTYDILSQCQLEDWSLGQRAEQVLQNLIEDEALGLVICFLLFYQTGLSY
jgi:hypothetical protein